MGNRPLQLGSTSKKSSTKSAAANLKCAKVKSPKKRRERSPEVTSTVTKRVYQIQNAAQTLPRRSFHFRVVRRGSSHFGFTPTLRRQRAGFVEPVTPFFC